MMFSPTVSQTMLWRLLLLSGLIYLGALAWKGVEASARDASVIQKWQPIRGVVCV